MHRHLLIATVVLAGTVVAACGDGGTSAGGGDGPRIAVTNTILGDVVRNLTGDLATVEVVVPSGADPHEFQPSARQVAALREAEVVVANGAGFEAGLDGAISGAEDDGAVVFEAIEHVAPLATAAGDDEHHDDEDDGHGHGPVDPHFFTDPARMATATEALATVLADEVPALATTEFRDRAAAYVDDLRALDAEVEATLADVPAERRKLVTDHDVLGYFGERYGFEIVGAVIESSTTQAAPSASDLDDLAATLRAEDVPAVFVDASAAGSLADTLADEVGDVAVVELFIESLGDDGSGADTYAGMARTNASRIAGALAP
ncbi:MAG: zinc ABC transporter substrate-binding protein [Acidimicrobiales bacterium]|nr:zinc ABC transporter substrate-binding protein [Acidimicrobiales bacterium]